MCVHYEEFTVVVLALPRSRSTRIFSKIIFVVS